VSILRLRPRKEINADVAGVSYEDYLEAVSLRKSLVRETFVMQQLTRQVSERLHAVREVHPQYASWEDKGLTTTPTSSGKRSAKPQDGPE
jgi:hypothetical protein